MKILLTGASGYIGKRLLPVLLDEGHEVYATVRDRNRFHYDYPKSELLHLIEIDFLKPQNEDKLPEDLVVAFYLIHSMTSSLTDFNFLEQQAAERFVYLINQTSANQIIYLSGISNADRLSKHLSSRLKVETILDNAGASLTTLRAGIIVGSGSASFEIIRDLVEKLPVMITPKWLNTRCQPISITNVIDYLHGVILNEACYGATYDIGGPDILTYKEMLLQFAQVRNLKRYILTLPVMTPRLSSYWLYFVTSISYKLAVNLVNSMKVEVICADNRIHGLIPLELIDYRTSIARAFARIEQNHVISSWKDAMVSSNKMYELGKLVKVPEHGCFRDAQSIEITNDVEQVLDNIWSVGGERGWYYGNFLWRIRGFIDKTFGGVGLRRGRTNQHDIFPGDALDFWRVIYCDKQAKRLLLYAEMKLPGEAWLEFKINSVDRKYKLDQTATFRPKGLWGRIYWYALLPFHIFVFKGMNRNMERWK